MEKYSLVGVDGNAYAIMGYVSKALRHSGLSDLCSSYIEEATSGDYDNLLAVSLEYIDKANESTRKKMFRIMSYYTACDAADLVKNGGWFETEYWSLVDMNDLELEVETESEDEAYQMWRIGGYSVSDFTCENDGCGIPTVYVRMYLLINDDTGWTEDSCGSITTDEIIECFPEFSVERVQHEREDSDKDC